MAGAATQIAAGAGLIKTGFPIRESQIRQLPNANPSLDEHLRRALNKIKRPSTAEEITELLNQELNPGDKPFSEEEVDSWLRDSEERVLRLYWLRNRPRR